jgi:hypothetical protein
MLPTGLFFMPSGMVKPADNLANWLIVHIQITSPPALLLKERGGTKPNLPFSFRRRD